MIGCCRNFWGDFGGNAFTDGLINSINNERITYAREMLCGRKQVRDDIPCSTCEIYIAMRGRSSSSLRTNRLSRAGRIRARRLPE